MRNIALMTVREQINRLEAEAAKKGLEVRPIVSAAGIHRATWDRWKAGATGPRMATWTAVLDAFRDAGVRA